MRTHIKLMAGAAVAATVAAMAVVPAAMADPPKGVTPRATDVVGVGSDTLEFLVDQFSLDYNKTIKKRAPHLYSWDALNPVTGLTDNIVAKKGCAKNPRPDGSSAGILAAKGGPLALTSNLKDGKKAFCTDFARSSRGRNAATDPPKGPGGIIFLTLAKDAVGWASNAGSPAPKNLTTAQLNAIYSCTDTNWNQVGGKNAPIDAQLPQTSSGTRAFFLQAIGVASPGACVDSTPGESPNNLPEENEGVNKYLTNKDVIYPYSIGKYLAQSEHSAKCTNKACTKCKPKKGQNAFGCDSHGNMVLGEVNGTSPTVGSGTKKTINPRFSASFVRLIYIVVRWTKNSRTVHNNIPANVAPIFGPKSWACTNKVAHKDMINYGFLPTPFCGAES
jgi:ABC-type phosphate transport system substrate-binding protein